MPTLKAIRRRIASTKSTQQITRAMKLVAAARLRRARQALIEARPYGEAMGRLAESVLHSMKAEEIEGAKPAALLFVVVSDRGLCGGYNANLLRAAEEEAQRLEDEGLTTGYFTVGRKALDHFKRSGARVAGDRVDNTPRLGSLPLARELAARALGDFRSGAARRVAVVYSRFHSALSQTPVVEGLLPVEWSEHETGAESGAVTEYLMEPPRERLVPIVLRSYLESSFFHALLEAEASEHAARMTSMDSATNNASKLIDQLTIAMNRARQAQITRELMDIVGGAEALRG